ncbi:VRR-NUC domain-containing protein [Lysobacter soli]|uniref:VRR-NUC domain-containing protein n=1 Tax=Lysobacter soli TaxID=453783 RepID=UPI00240F941B|nr:VRR-NUC domain-containing protein [Lysobacter soli]MDG2517380.1 VRR-NUC domain-containing protein [Lysobacter soli]
MASLVGTLPCDGGDLLEYLKQLRRIVEAPPGVGVSRVEGALARVEAIRAIVPLRTYSYDQHLKLRPSAILEDYGPKIFRTPQALLDFVLNAVYGASYKSLGKEEKAWAKAAGSESTSYTIGGTLSSQSDALGWPQLQLRAAKVRASTWRSPTGIEGGPETVALSMICRPSERGSFCEGDSVKVLMKAACFGLLVKHNMFHDRVDAARRYFEAQCTILVDRRSEIVGAIRSSNADAVASALDEILKIGPAASCDVPLDAGFMLELYARLSADRLAAIAELFVQRPYDYRAGWPDLTLVGEDGVRFVEIKTTDRFHESQVRFARDIAAPLGLRCEVIQLLHA